MPLTYRIDLANRVVWTFASGEITDGQIAAHVRHLRTDSRFAPDFRQFIAAHEVDNARITRAGLTVLAGLNPFGVGARRAWVTGTDVEYGIARMYELLLGDSKDTMMVFRDKAAALEWLDLRSTWEPPPASPDDPIFDGGER